MHSCECGRRKDWEARTRTRTNLPTRRVKDRNVEAGLGNSRSAFLPPSITMILTAAQKGKGRAQVTETTPKRPSKALVSRLSISSEPTSDSDANSSDSDSSTPHSSSSGSESDSEDEIALEHMKSLLEKARQIAREKKIAVVTLSEGEDKEEEVIHLEVEPEAYVLLLPIRCVAALK